MKVGVIGYDRGHLGRCSKLRTVKFIMFHQKWINLSERRRNIRRKKVFRKKNESEIKERNGGRQGFRVIQFHQRH